MHDLLYGGARSTKTFLICYAICQRALMANDSRHLIARLHHNDVRMSVMMDTWPKMMRLMFSGLEYDQNKSDQVAILPNKSEIWFGGLDDKDRVEKVLGREYATIFLNECSQISYDTVLMVRTRLAQNVLITAEGHPRIGQPLALRAYYDLNPVGRGHWTYKEWIAGVDPTRGDVKLDPDLRSYAVLHPRDNPYLPKEFLRELENLPERQRKRFFDGEYQSEVPGTLWPIDRIDACRVDNTPELTRIVVGVDPSGSDGVGGDMQGIVVVGLGVDHHAYVIADMSCRMSPAGWGTRVIEAYRQYNASLIVVERNFGGAMVENTIRTIDRNAPVRLVTASTGKSQRAEPIASLYEPRPDKPCTVHHVGRFQELEDQMSQFSTDGYQGSGSPDRADALIWALSELMVRMPGESKMTFVAGLI
jgi:phage terminase large subunit-like protein